MLEYVYAETLSYSASTDLIKNGVADVNSASHDSDNHVCSHAKESLKPDLF